MLALYLLSTESTKNTGSVPSCEKVEKYYLLQILQQPDETDTLQKKANLRTEWTKSTPICTPQNLYCIVLNNKIRLSGAITKQKNRRYNYKK